MAPADRPITPASVASTYKKTRVHNVTVRKTGNHKGYAWGELVAISGTVIPAVALPVLAVTAWSAGVVCLAQFTKFFESWLPANSTILITVLGVVLGLLVVFRTNTAYERYMEGRRLWGTVIVNLRNLSRLIWIGIHAKGNSRLTPHEYAQKCGAMNLLLAFASATKHYLRDEDDADYEDLAPYIRHIPEFSDTNLMHYKHEDGRIIALDITHHLAAYIAGVKSKDQIDANIQSLLNTALNALVDNFSNFERVRNTPVPLAYSSLLKQIVMIYLVALPFQIVGQVKWLTIPIVFLGAFCLLGIENIGGEIENPFGYDSNDLPMDAYCEEFRVELTSLMSRSVKINPEDWVEPYNIATVPEHYRKQHASGSNVEVVVDKQA
ncbi:Bestrophin/UPF0187 [Cladochytrium replicatum]|nr:Bestrophin/UPF0187 [Cladochytrium replicatum]